MSPEPLEPLLPKGYMYRQRLFEAYYQHPAWYFLLWGNLMALLPLGFVILVVWLPYQLYLARGTPLALFPNPTWPLTVQVLVGGMCIGVVLISHELLHGLALRVLGHHPRFGFAEGFFLTGLEAGTFLPRNHYLVMALTPFFALTLGGGLVLLCLPALPGRLWLIALLLNAAGSVGDWLVVNELRRWPAEALFADHESIRVYLPAAPQADASA